MEIESLIKKLKVLPNPKKTYLEILKVHDKEVYMANLLAYFFRDKETHGLGNLFIKSLLQTQYYELDIKKYPKSVSTIISQVGSEIKQNDILNSIENVKVQTEVRTSKDNDDNKRIDILINTESFIFCIEFKINHKLNNPLETYRSHITNTFKDSTKKVFYIVLTPSKKEADVPNVKEYLENNSDFKQVIINHFVNKIELPLDFIESDDFIYFKDFIQTIENREIKYKRESLLRKLNEFLNYDYHSNNKGGFIKINKLNYFYKIRINDKHYQIEKWTSEISKESINLVDLNTSFTNLKQLIL
jgi:hypothetical protein